MNRRAALILFGLGLAVFGASFAPDRAVTGGQKAQAGAAVFPGLPARLAEASEIEITAKGETLPIQLVDGQWVLPGKDGFRALNSRVHALLTGLAELRLAEPRTSDLAFYARLGVDDPARPESSATLIRVLDARGAPLAALILGHSRTRMQESAGSASADSLYIRRPEEATSWLANGALDVSADAATWIDRAVLDIASGVIAKATIQHGEETITLAMRDGKLALTAPADHPKLDDLKIQEIGVALQGLTLEDVRRTPADPGTITGSAEFTLTNGLVLGFSTYHDGNDTWTEITASGPDSAALARKLAGWQFKLGHWKDEMLAPTLAQLLAPAPKP
jgi:hypothetical protein